MPYLRLGVWRVSPTQLQSNINPHPPLLVCPPSSLTNISSFSFKFSLPTAAVGRLCMCSACLCLRVHVCMYVCVCLCVSIIILCVCVTHGIQCVAIVCYCFSRGVMAICSILTISFLLCVCRAYQSLHSSWVP